MKKLWICLALLLVALVAVACNDQPVGETDSTHDTIAETDPSGGTEALEVPTEAPTVPPEWLTYDETEKVIEIPTSAPTEEPETEAPADPAVPAIVLGTDELTSQQGIYDLANGFTVTDGYVTITPTGADPYYYPKYSFTGARYIIIKYRTSNCDGVYMQAYLASSGTGPSDDGTMVQGRLVGDGNWNYLVIDTQPLIDAGKYDGKTVSYLRFDPLDPGYALDENGEKYKDAGGHWVRATMPAGATVDVAYIAFCHAPDTMQNLEAEAS